MIMPIDIWIAFALLALTFLITPGVSHILMLSNSLTYGPRRAMATGLGDLSANALQMLAAGLGMAAVIAKAPNAFTAVKWVGVAYLVYLGVKMMRTANFAPSVTTETVSRGALFRQGFVTSGSNPKAIMFFAALFPQFISADLPFWPQQLILMLTYLVFDGAFLAFYGISAGAISKRLSDSSMRWVNIISGAMIIIGAVILAFKTAT